MDAGFEDGTDGRAIVGTAGGRRVSRDVIVHRNSFVIRRFVSRTSLVRTVPGTVRTRVPFN